VSPCSAAVEERVFISKMADRQMMLIMRFTVAK